MCDITKIIVKDSPVTHIHLASIHFGENDQGDPYIHLNDFSPYNDCFDRVWKDMETATQLGIKVKLLVGGAGGAFTKLFSDYTVYYSFLKELLLNKSFISGIDLDVEEQVDIKDIQKLIIDLKVDLGENFTVCMAPVQYSIQTDVPGFGGFSYKQLIKSPAGKHIDYLNGQFYEDFSYEAYEDVIKNKYAPSCIVMGMEGTNNLTERLSIIHKLYLTYGDNFGGVYLWEYCLGDPNWATLVKNVLKRTFFEKICSIL